MIVPFRNSVELSMDLSEDEEILSYVFSSDGDDVKNVVFEDELLAIALDKHMSEAMRAKRRLYVRFKWKVDFAYVGKYSKEQHRIVFERETQQTAVAVGRVSRFVAKKRLAASMRS